MIVFERIRTEVTTGHRSEELSYAVTSLSTAQADAQTILARKRGHWTIENCVHYVRDIAFDEDRSQVRQRTLARAMASLRNLAMGVLHRAGASNIAASLRYCSRQADRPLRLIGL